MRTVTLVPSSMWSVIRKRQGLPYNAAQETSGDAAFAKNGAHLVAHEVKPFPTPMDDCAVTLAYGNRTMPKMTNLLSDSRVVVRVRTLDMLTTLLAEPKNVAQACESGIVAALTGLLTDDYSEVRSKALLNLGMLASSEIGNSHVVEQGSISSIAPLFTDDDVAVKANSFLTVVDLTSFGDGSQAVVDDNCVPLLVEHSSSNVPEVQCLAMDALYNCYKIEVALLQALEVGAVAVMTGLLDHENATVAEKAARNLFCLVTPDAGKTEGIDCGAVPLLAKLLLSDDPLVRESAGGTLMLLCIAVKGKNQAYDCSLHQTCIGLLRDPNHVVVLNVTKLICTLAEHKHARQELKDALPTLQDWSDAQDVNPAIVASAKTAIAKINWEP